MILGPDPPDRDVTSALLQPAGGQHWRAMIRTHLQEPGLKMRVRVPNMQPSSSEAASSAGVTLHVEQLLGEWEEEGEDLGVEAVLRFCTTSEAAAAASAATAEAEARPADASTLLLHELFDALGETPLPPYMRREARAEDRERYQTVYASETKQGSVAAPTAGLHFTPGLLAALEANGVESSRVALHVGAGTFKPVTAETLADHEMHAERFSIAAHELDAIAASAAAGYPIVPVGTTSARVLESVYWLGVRKGLGVVAAADGGKEGGGSGSSRADGRVVGTGSSDCDWDLGRLGQWSGYSADDVEVSERARLSDVFSALAAEARAHGHEAVGGSTSLCIAPGYAFRVCDAMITNFHAPDSSLMFLVSALVGGSDAMVGSVYRHAVASRYRFLSYGDASLLIHPTRKAARALATSVRANLAMGDALDDADEALVHAAAEVASGPGGERAEAAYWSGPRLPQQHKTGRKVLLHSCCAPCSGAMVEAMVGAGHDVTIFFYNPNIHPRKEYEIRKQENKRYAQQLGIDFVDLDGDVVGGIDVDEWYKRAKGMEFCPERGARCSMCFDMRLERTALYAFENGFDSFTTTNATSRWKDEAQVNASGMKAASKYPGVEYWLSDWQGEEMTARKYKINAEQRFYKQEYCGCSYSLRDSNHWRSKQGMPPVQVGGDSYYSDPAADEQEEAVEVVESFFSDSATFEEELKKTYAARRKDARRSDGRANNW